MPGENHATRNREDPGTEPLPLLARVWFGFWRRWRSGLIALLCVAMLAHLMRPSVGDHLAASLWRAFDFNSDGRPDVDISNLPDSESGLRQMFRDLDPAQAPAMGMEFRDYWFFTTASPRLRKLSIFGIPVGSMPDMRIRPTFGVLGAVWFW